MTLALAASITMVSAANDACNRPSATEVVTCHNIGAGVVRRFSLNTFTQVGSDYAVINSPQGITMVSNDVAFVASYLVNSISLVNLTSLVVTQIDSLDYLFDNNRSQLVAADPVLGQGIMCGFTSGTIVLFTTTTAVLSQPIWLRGTRASSVICTGGDGLHNSYFLVSTEAGDLISVILGPLGFSYSVITLPQVKPITLNALGAVTTQKVISMSVHDSSGMVLVSTNWGMLYVLSATGTVIHKYMMPATGLVMSNIDGTTCLLSSYSSSASARQQIYEIDMGIYPVNFRGTIFNSEVTQGVRAMGMQGTKAWMIAANQTKLHVYNISGQRTTAVKNLSIDIFGAGIYNLGYDIICIRDPGAGSAVVDFVGRNTRTVTLATGAQYVFIATDLQGVNESTVWVRVTV